MTLAPSVGRSVQIRVPGGSTRPDKETQMPDINRRRFLQLAGASAAFAAMANSIEQAGPIPAHRPYGPWLPAKTPTTMAYLTREDIPFHYALADKFTVCDAYHCSFMGSTDPNRYYMWTGYTGNDGTGGGPVLGNDEAGYGWTTYPERLEKAGVSWKIYQDAGDGLDAAGGWGWIQDAYRGNYGGNPLL